MNVPVLDIQDLCKTFDSFTAVNSLNFQVDDGQFFSILGPSGCGKTTLLRMIAGFLRPTSGRLCIAGKDVTKIPPNHRPVNLVFQNLALFPMMNVYENIAFGLKRQGVHKTGISRKVGLMLERIHLSGYGSKKISQLSGGQKQRVAIARSLVLEPSLLLLDEPLGALDLKLREQMKIELKKLQAEVGTTFMYITHDQSEALVMSDRVAVMNHGQFEQIGSPRELYRSPATSFVAGFVGETNIIPVQRISRTENEYITVTSGFGLEFLATLRSEGPATAAGYDLYVRPEAIVLNASASAPHATSFTLLVRNILFDGSNTKILATFENSDFELTVALPQNQLFAQIAVGDTVTATVDAESCLCFPRR